MKKMTTGCFAVLVALVSAGSLLAHHSLGNFDTTKAVRVKGTVVQVNLINPHSFIYLEQRDAEGHMTRWAAEGPSTLQLTRKGFGKDALKVGDVVEVCGYEPKERTTWQIASANSNSVSLAGRLINAETLVMPDGKLQSWGDYGVHKCFEPGYTDQHESR
jgi:Family of unknown function (DUF6152)